ncbi:YjbF family lipoprotein [Salipiger sp.]|uniref:YjbF family lipoprotein n=1 Tax=Salipiger sp. TaxID=2078585 RepID=UPI003A96E014
MNGKTILRTAAVLASCLVLGACGNDPYRGNSFEVLYDSLFKGDAAPQPVTAAQIAQVMAATDLPMAFVNIEERKAQTVLIRIETNGPYGTYATADRKNMVMRNGMITSTRGLGDDLMSTDVDAVLSLVRKRTTGNAVYIQRFLRSDDATRVLTYRCGVEPDKSVDVAMGLVRGRATEVIVACESEDGPPFVDYYVVDGSGEILASRQWLGVTTGYVAMHRLRL